MISKIALFAEYASNRFCSHIHKKLYFSLKFFMQFHNFIVTRMTDVKSNFRNLYQNNLDCQTCNEICIEDENHLLICENLKNEESVKTNFSKVYGSIEDQLQIVKVFKNILRKRETILET